MFHCRNRGHQPRKIPASQVNDGVCDCCDGRDEHDGRVTCANECVKLGASKRAELTERVARARGGYDQKRALVQAGPAKRELWQKQIEQLKIEIELQKLKVEKAAMIKSNAERAEKAANKAAEALKKAEEAKKAAEAAAQKLADAENGVAADEEDAPAADAASSAVSSEAGAEAASPAAEDDREETEEERGQRIARQWIKTGGGDATGDSGDATAGDVGDAEADAQAPAAEKGEKDADDDDVDAPPFEKPTEWDDEEDGEWLPPEAPELAERAYTSAPLARAGFPDGDFPLRRDLGRRRSSPPAVGANLGRSFAFERFFCASCLYLWFSLHREGPGRGKRAMTHAGRSLLPRLR